MRTPLTLATALVGVILAVTSFALALRQVREIAQPIPYLPAVFILGVMLTFLAAVVYELVPDRPEDSA